MTIGTAYLESVCKRFAEYKTMGDKTFAQLSDVQMLQKPNNVSNSIGVIIQHLHGNMRSRWTNFLTEDGEKSWRQRDAEFDPQPLTKEQLLQQWEEGWTVLLNTLHSLKEEDLLKTITIRAQPLLVLDAINRQLAHYSSHVGQLVYIGRWLKKGEWQSLSITRGGSAAYTKELQQQYLQKPEP